MTPYLEEPLQHMKIATTYDLIGDLHNSVQEMRGVREGKAFNNKQKEEKDEPINS